MRHRAAMQHGRIGGKPVLPEMTDLLRLLGTNAPL
jgi:hypothetical protein